jgi:hypothetical protein
MPKGRPARSRRGNERGRSTASYGRLPGNRQPRPSILIVCEGQETERTYFEALRRAQRLPTQIVQIVGAGRAPISVVERALELQEQRNQEARLARHRQQVGPPSYDQVWCVFDMEGFQQQGAVLPAIALAQTRGFELAVSNPAFEFWYLLHFEETSRPFHDADEVFRALRRHMPDYAKNLDVAARLARNTDTAIERAEVLLARNAEPALTFPNPSTSVHRLVRLLQSMAIR